MAKYKLKEGKVLHPYGTRSKIDNSNLTDEIAELMIKKGRAKKTDFIIKKNTSKDGNSK
tara:strand:+ start:802 stop:978 length:177 start_codon:yes stop_codon:yes gene_type:complete